MSPKVAIFYKTTASDRPWPKDPYKAGGLSVNALHTVGVLREMGVHADLVPVKDYDELRYNVGTIQRLTHVVVEAIWMTVEQTFELAKNHPDITFVVRAHSKIGFLQVEPEAIPKMRAILAAHDEYPNLWCSSNNEEFSHSLSQVYDECLYLPNLYDIRESPPRKRHGGDVLKIASFGATRLLKLHPNAALAALQISQLTGRPLEFYINSDKTPGGESVRNTIRNLLANQDHVKLIEVGWQPAHEFRETIAGMDLVIQLSCTETFCLVAADAVASGVPVVVGPAITWVPKKYQVNIDNTTEAAEMGARNIVLDERVAKVQFDALKQFVKEAKASWRAFLGIPKPKKNYLSW